MNVFEAIRANDAGALRERLDLRPEEAGARDDAGRSPVLLALSLGHEDLIDVLLDVNPPLDVFDSAAVGRTRGLGELLEGEPALARSVAPDGFTPLHLAALYGQKDAAELLLEAGADPSARDAEGQTPRDRALAAGHEDVAEKLV